MIRVQEAPFEVGAELAALTRGRTDIGGLASFVGLVRDVVGERATGKRETGEQRAGEQRIGALTLEHYPGMTERKLAEIEAEARRRWPLQASLIVHRYGRMLPGEPIVLVATASAHRAAALEACAFLIDWLKTQAPFWKLEESPDGSHWVAARAADDEAAARWQR